MNLEFRKIKSFDITKQNYFEEDKEARYYITFEVPTDTVDLNTFIELKKLEFKEKSPKKIIINI